jgi:CHAD domain-containing protein
VLEAAAFLAKTGNERIGRFRERLKEAAADPTSEKAVHDLRVSIRRVIAWTAVWEGLLGPDPVLREARASLKKLMSPLGKLRDAHVKRDAIRRHVPSGDRPSYLYAVLVASDVLRWEGRVRKILRERWPAEIRIRAPKKRVAPGSGIDVAAGASRLLAQLAKGVAKHRKAALDPAKPEALHRMRLDFKKYRYAAEVFSPLYPRAGKAAAKRHQAFQTLLGTIHDCDVVLAETGSFRKVIMESRGETTLEAAFRRLREEKFREFRRIAGNGAGFARMFGKTLRS